MKKINFTALVVVILQCSLSYASSPPPKKYTPVSRTHTFKEEATDIGVIYLAQWVLYPITQYDVFSKIQGKDWVENVFEKGAVLWDGDEWYWNFAGHPLAGSEYYLYFRSRGYTPKWSFVGSLISSTIWEELTETFTEPFSTNDFVVTPVLGSLLGYGREKAALRLLQTDNKFYRGVGHVLWIETNFKFFEKVEVIPAISPDGSAGGISFVAVY